MSSIFLKKIFRNLSKFIYKIMVSEQYKHNRFFWPYYKVNRSNLGSLQQVFFNKKLVSDNTKKIHTSNYKCMIIATGPSIKKIKDEVFMKKNIDYIGVNGAIAHSSINFKFYTIIDVNFIKNKFDLVEVVLERKIILFLTPICLDEILRRIDYENIICEIKVIELIKRNNIDRFLGTRKNVDLYNSEYFIRKNFGFSKNIFHSTFDYLTVAYVALQIAYFLKYSTIYLAGLDMNNFNLPRFYEDNKNKQKTLLNLHMEDIIFPAFDTASLFFKSKNIDVFNLSNESSVKSFKKIDSSEI